MKRVKIFKTIITCDPQKFTRPMIGYSILFLKIMLCHIMNDWVFMLLFYILTILG